MTHQVHLSDDLMVRAVDQELTLDERLFVERHLSVCPPCRERRRQWAELSDCVQDLIVGTAQPVDAASRARLAAALGEPVIASPVEVRRRRWIWPSVGVAAAAACLLMLAAAPVALRVRPWMQKQMAIEKQANISSPSPAAVSDGEGDFIPLPYSATGAAPGDERIVRVELPVSTLAAEGILPPDSLDSAAAAGEEWVLADVALGLDGQPAGIRLVNESDVRN